MKIKRFPIPVSFHIFNSYSFTCQVFNQIRLIQPQKLFITADGPRDNVTDDLVNCEKTRSILDLVDWDCEVFKNFSETNKGSYKSTSYGISWVFSHVDKAIFLEDDCVPHLSFFRYCRELLDYYENDNRVALISGSNFQTYSSDCRDSYFFSRYSFISGWATWKRTWDNVDLKLNSWPKYRDLKGLESVFTKKVEVKFWTRNFNDLYNRKIGPHWDYALTLSNFMNNSLCIVPKTNLVTNIGFGDDRTNTKTKKKYHCLKIDELSFPLTHPSLVRRADKADNYFEKKFYRHNLWTYLLKTIEQFLPKNLVLILKPLYKKIFRV